MYSLARRQCIVLTWAGVGASSLARANRENLTVALGQSPLKFSVLLTADEQASRDLSFCAMIKKRDACPPRGVASPLTQP
jgi:hypothetical protein